LLAPDIGRQPDEMPGWSSLLVGPLFRGAEVSFK
jgi:phospholipid/cholesterol/gamma-HCH transport system substrate-binding protein